MGGAGAEGGQDWATVLRWGSRELSKEWGRRKPRSFVRGPAMRFRRVFELDKPLRSKTTDVTGRTL